MSPADDVSGHRHAGDSRLFVVDREGVIRIVQSTVPCSARRPTSAWWVLGSQGCSVSPSRSYSTNGFLYVDYVNLDGNIVIARCA
jgi:hypothetical protein